MRQFLILINIYKDKLYLKVSKIKYIGQKDLTTFDNYYIPNITITGQGIYFDTKVYSFVNNFFISLMLLYNLKLI